MSNEIDLKGEKKCKKSELRIKSVVPVNQDECVGLQLGLDKTI